MRNRVSVVLLSLALSCALAASSRAQDGSRSLWLGAGGDLLLHIRLIEAAEGLEGGWDRVLGPLQAITAGDDLSFANLETPLSTAIEPCTGSPPTLGAPPEAAASLARAGLDVVSVANNHAYDQLASGIAETQRALSAAGVASVGAGADDTAALAPWITTTHGLRVAFLAVTERINGRPGSAEPERVVARWDEAAVLTAITTARAQADIVVVSVHWSHDFVREPTRGQRERAAAMIEGGADVILGHGPHVLHGVERVQSARGDALVAYSLGNLVSNQGMRHRAGRRPPRGAHIATTLGTTRDGAWLRASIALADGRVVIGAVEATPLYTYNNYFARVARSERIPDVRVQRLRDSGDDALIAERRATISAALGSAVTLLP